MAKLSGYKYGTEIRYKNPNYERHKVAYDNVPEYLTVKKKGYLIFSVYD